MFLLIAKELLLESEIVTRLSIKVVSAVYLEFSWRRPPNRLLSVALVVAGDLNIVDTLSKELSHVKQPFYTFLLLSWLLRFYSSWLILLHFFFSFYFKARLLRKQVNLGVKKLCYWLFFGIVILEQT